jgi:hypothetical protein
VNLVASCGECEDGWICEEHPDQPMGHEHCSGAGMPCQNPKCPYRTKRTGLVCPMCKTSMGDIEHQADRTIRFRCKSCRYQWWADTKPDQLR